MSHRLETVLENRCHENPDFTVLRAQWDFDKRLLSAALQAVGHSFPHYSRHDASHSHTILIQGTGEPDYSAASRAWKPLG